MTLPILARDMDGRPIRATDTVILEGSMLKAESRGLILDVVGPGALNPIQIWILREKGFALGEVLTLSDGQVVLANQVQVVHFLQTEATWKSVEQITGWRAPTCKYRK